MLSQVLLAALAVPVAGCDALLSADIIAGKTIRYQVEYSGPSQDAGSDRALFVEYSTSDGPQRQTDVELPWTKVVGVAPRGFEASVKVQYDGFGDIACRIVADSTVIAEQTIIQQPYPVVECAA